MLGNGHALLVESKYIPKCVAVAINDARAAQVNSLDFEASSNSE